MRWLAWENNNRGFRSRTHVWPFHFCVIALGAIATMSFSGQLCAQDNNEVTESAGKRYYSEQSGKTETSSTRAKSKSRSKSNSPSTKRAQQPVSYYDFAPIPSYGGPAPYYPVMVPTPVPAWRGMIWPQGSPCSPVQ